MILGVVVLEKDRVHISALLDLYGAALSVRQRDVLTLYYNDDLSLAEIAEDTGITRQGVRDAIVKGERELCDLEEKLGFLAKTKRVRETAEAIAAEAAVAENKQLCELSARLMGEI